MPPRIRSETPSSNNSDQLQDDTPPPPPPARSNRVNLAAPKPNSTAANSAASSTTGNFPVGGPTDEDEDDSLSSLEDSGEEGPGQQAGAPPRRADSEMDDDEEEEEEDDEEEEEIEDDENFSADSEEDYDEEEMDELDELDEILPVSTSRSSKSKKKATGGRATAASKTATRGGGSRRSSAASSSVANVATASAGTGVKIKFKLGGGGASARATAPSKATSAVRWDSRTGNSPKGKGKKRKVEEDELSDEVDFDDGFSDASEHSSVSGTRLTARQRAKEMGGEQGMELQSLPNHVVHVVPKVKLTEAEIALRRSEVSRRRKSQSDAKLESEKTETINRLLKKQVGKVGRPRSKLSSTTIVNPNNQSGAPDEDPELVAPAAVAVVAPVLPTRIRYVSSVRDGEYKCLLGIPVGALGTDEVRKEVAKAYPGPRPPLKTRRLEKTQVAVKV